MNADRENGAPRVVRGTPVDLRALKRGKIFFTSYTPRLRYAWDTGEAISRYLEELKHGRLIARRCHRCQRVMIPPRMFCERCFRPTDEWVYVRDSGKVNTFSLCYVTWDVRRLKQPEIPSVIEIDGASPGMGILHLVKRVKPKEMRVGLEVKAVWKPAAKRVGSITDISHWEPISRRG
ncbi:MAG TPA: Zn-ribbon domain-containing OB-fold protein [Candidatus Acidoferrales bacterium]|nr:Zn-ribbon domain-containing OB-fold protein [Candidatus Acidoferrales bacterium]